MAAQQRFVISVRVVGAIKKDKPKLKMFMMSLLWSDESEVVIYRSFKDFKKFHGKLKKRFPEKKNRMIPKFNGKASRISHKQKGTQHSILRMQFLEAYCNQLLKCDQAVTQSSEVKQFFLSNDRDLQPDFSKNSVMIMMSDDQSGRDAHGQQPIHITPPCITETYRCLAAYETKDTKNRPFKVTLGEKLDVLMKDPSGWWMVENEAKHLAWFPAPYLEELKAKEDEDDSVFSSGGDLYCAVRSYSTKMDDEVSVPIGSVVEVLRRSHDGWWLIRFNGKGGYIPSMYLKPYNIPGQHSLLPSSSLKLATSRRSSVLPSVNEESGRREGSAGQSKRASTVSWSLHKALDIISESRPQKSIENGRKMDNTSMEELGYCSSSHLSSSKEEGQQQLHGPNGSGLDLSSSKRCSYNTSGKSRGSLIFNVRAESTSSTPRIPTSPKAQRCSYNTSGESHGSLIFNVRAESTSLTPRIPTRPKAQEILTRCTPRTRNAALGTKNRHASLPVYYG